MPREKSCGAVVFRRDRTTRYLLLKYGAGHWDLVKGHGKRHEREEETVLRELREETGIAEARFIPGFRKEISYFYKRRAATIHKTVVYYLIETPREEVVLSDEHVAYLWLPFPEAVKTVTFRNSRDVLEEAHRLLKERHIIADS
ncbi:MAG: NUDIX domain-containing protein [Methanomicrobiaceae archaeon]|uniref:Bis(5'-nucleosyl)-tetraphosphatase [asymmetrical] n=1 Tax=hydrocarbon metagenome TaxID=938273 RepID=A0A0W8FHC3_9ZZZZ|nr:NUDIX domain-containing protein [Methanomicrobiaceae archaeon]MDD5418536.1 NUDIX domain-containing protein [Methanomicrobiaceae archaeon]